MSSAVDIRVVKRDGTAVGFDRSRIESALKKAFAAIQRDISISQFDILVDGILAEIVATHSSGTNANVEAGPSAGVIKVEDIQDLVEKHLVKAGLYEVSKAYILYRAERNKEREERKSDTARKAEKGLLNIVDRTGEFHDFDPARVEASLRRAANGFGKDVSVDAMLRETLRTVFDGISTNDLERAMSQAASAFIERDPGYAFVAARLLNRRVVKDVASFLGVELPAAPGVGAGHSSDAEGDNFPAAAHSNDAQPRDYSSVPTTATGGHAPLAIGNELSAAYRASFAAGIKIGIAHDVFAPALADFDLNRMASALKLERDELLEYQGVQTLHERYLARVDDKPIETLQAFWMRVAMGLSILESDKEIRALEFYEVLSSLRFVASTPTLFHSGLTHPQLSSCYVSTVDDDLTHIFKVIGDNAQLSKWSGGIGNDWTSVRATGSFIKTTKVQSQGVIPFLKIMNDATLAINRSGKRRGAACAYLETWHLDLEDFLDLRRNTGDERRRTHDMNTANWVPDLFMKRVKQNGTWTLFSPNEVEDLHDLYGKAFEKRYEFYEAEAKAGRIKQFKEMEAVKLWRKMLARLFETGHPWITFKDPCNIRSPQDHAGVVHNSNLCTEITLNNSATETAVCNLGSINLAVHTGREGLNEGLLAATTKTAIRMLDNVIDINFYPTIEARDSNIRHRPVGMGIMGFQDALFIQGLSFADAKALEFADYSMEFISYHAILGSSTLAAERGAYASYKGSKWDRGIFPLDTLDLLEQERGMPVNVDRISRMDWSPVRAHVAKHGMRNSNTMAVAPTATISTIAGSLPCIEPIYKNIYVKSNMTGEFTVVNTYLIDDLKTLGLWGPEMLSTLKFHDGSLQGIANIPESLKERYKEAFEIDPIRLIEFTAVRGKWIDQSQSHNVFMRGTSGTLLSDIYAEAWDRGLKTTYYLRTLAASQIEKSTLDASYGFTQKRPTGEIPAASVSGKSVAPAGAPSAGTLTAVSPAGTQISAAQSADTGNAASTGRKALVSSMVLQPVPGLAADGLDLSAIPACKIEDPDCESCQ